MSLPKAPVDICNLALDKVGQAPITSIDPPRTPTETLMARHFDQVRQELLREHPFNFSERTTTFKRTGDAPGSRYADKYLIPKGICRINVLGPDTENRITNFHIQDDPDGNTVILCNNDGAETVEATCQFDITDVSKFDAGFRKCFVLALAQAVCYQITKSNSTWNRLDRELKESLPTMISVDAAEQPPEVIERNSFIESRLQGTDYRDQRYTDLRNL